MANDPCPYGPTLQRMTPVSNIQSTLDMTQALVSRFTVLIERAATALAGWIGGAFTGACAPVPVRAVSARRARS